MSVRAQMIHRCTIERDANAGQIDGYGGSVAPDWRQHVAEQPCYYYEPRAQRGEVVDGQKVAILYAHQVMVPAGVDVTEADRIHGITDRRGASVADHAFGITRIVRRRDHLLLTLEVAT